MPQRNVHQLLLVGDSDIEYWPEKLFPQIRDDDDDDDDSYQHYLEIQHSGHSGATLTEILPYIESLLSSEPNTKDDVGDDDPYLSFVVVCAGENDIGQGKSLESSVEALRQMMGLVLFDTRTRRRRRHFIFLGPKFEPWLEDDYDSKKQYATMSRSFERCCHEFGEERNVTNNVHFIDCLTMFCGDTANIPGAALGGRAKAEEKYFSSDRLHLNDEGYKVWKSVVEIVMEEHVNPS
jgi:lysophospholipase L1-like esterase